MADIRASDQMLNRCSGFIACAFVWLSTALPANANDNACPDVSDAVPAMLIDNEENQHIVSTLINKWRTDETTRIALVEGYVRDTGKLRNLMVSKSSYGAINRNLLLNRMRRLAITPARINGEPVSVYVTFTIVAKKLADQFETFLVINRLHYLQEHGMYYSAPQRIADDSLWPISTGQTAVDIGAYVGVDGTVIGLHEETGDDGATHLEKKIAKGVRNSCFIPGIVDGRPQEMLYVELFASGMEAVIRSQ